MNIVIANLATADATHNRLLGGRNSAGWWLVQDDAHRASAGGVEQRDPRGRSIKIFPHGYPRSRPAVRRRLPRGPTRTGSLTVAVIGSARFAITRGFGADQHEGHQRAEDGKRRAGVERPPEALDEGGVRRVRDVARHRVRSGGGEGDEHGEAKHVAHLGGGGQEPRSQPPLLAAQGRGPGARRGHGRETHAQTHQDEPRQEDARITALRGDPQEERYPNGDREQAGGNGDPGPDPACEPRAQKRARDHREVEGYEGDPRLGRRQARDLLEVEYAEEERRVGGGLEREGDETRAHEFARAEDAQGYERVPDAGLDRGEGRHERRRQPQSAQGAPGGKTHLLRSRETVDQERQGRRYGRRARHIELRGGGRRVAAL